MNTPSSDKQTTGRPGDNEATPDRVMQDIFEDTALSTYRYVLMATDTEVPGEMVHLESEEINLGDVVEIEADNGKKDYFSVDHINVDQHHDGDVTTVYLIRARNSLWKSLLLLAILGVSWYIIDFILNKFL